MGSLIVFQGGSRFDEELAMSLKFFKDFGFDEELAMSLLVLQGFWGRILSSQEGFFSLSLSSPLLLFLAPLSAFVSAPSS